MLVHGVSFLLLGTLSNTTPSRRNGGQTIKIQPASIPFAWKFSCPPPRLIDLLFLLKVPISASIILLIRKLRQVSFDIGAGNSNLAKSLSEKGNRAMYQDENPHSYLLSLQNKQNWPFFFYFSDLNTQN